VATHRLLPQRAQAGLGSCLASGYGTQGICGFVPILNADWHGYYSFPALQENRKLNYPPEWAHGDNSTLSLHRA
jgi:hypothetical protein